MSEYPPQVEYYPSYHVYLGHVVGPILIFGGTEMAASLLPYTIQGIFIYRQNLVIVEKLLPYSRLF